MKWRPESHFNYCLLILISRRRNARKVSTGLAFFPSCSGLITVLTFAQLALYVDISQRLKWCKDRQGWREKMGVPSQTTDFIQKFSKVFPARIPYHICAEFWIYCTGISSEFCIEQCENEGGVSNKKNIKREHECRNIKAGTEFTPLSFSLDRTSSFSHLSMENFELIPTVSIRILHKYDTEFIQGKLSKNFRKKISTLGWNSNLFPVIPIDLYIARVTMNLCV